MKKLSYLIILLLFAVGIGCDEACPDCIPYDTAGNRDFYPMDTNLVQFHVDSFIVVGNPGDIRMSSSIMEEKLIMLPETQDGQNFVLNRVYRNASDGQLLHTSAVLGFMSETQMSLSDGINLIYLKFPLSTTFSEWDGRRNTNPDLFVLFDDEPIEYFFSWPNLFQTSFSIQEEIQGVMWDSVLTVTHVDHDGLTERRYSIEKYAKNVGLVYKEIQVFNEFCNQADDICRTDLDWLLRANLGMKYISWRID